jgi:hypothetical protein
LINNLQDGVRLDYPSLRVEFFKFFGSVVERDENSVEDPGFVAKKKEPQSNANPAPRKRRRVN